MIRNSRLLTICALLFCCICCNKESNHIDYRIVPLPHSIGLKEGANNSFAIDENVVIVCDMNQDAMVRNGEFLSSYIEDFTSIALPISHTKSGFARGITLTLDHNITQKDGYTIEVERDQINIIGQSNAAVFYAIQTLQKAMFANTSKVIELPAATINDYPLMGYRGIMLDVARTFYPASYLKRFIDLVALHNLNVLHLHLTDDQGWRLEIEKYPRLTELSNGEYYTQAQMKEIVEYAAERYITIIPEIDMPGHIESALAAYPELGCVGQGYAISSKAGVRTDVLCVGSEFAMEFVKDVLYETMQIFPSKYIHIGGDEVPTKRWEECPLCQERCRKESLKTERELQRYINFEVESYLSHYNRHIIGWDEIVDGGLSNNATVMSWRGINGGVKAAKLGYDVIMSPTDNLYFDYYQSVNIESEPIAIGGYVTMNKVYEFNPHIAEQLTKDEQNHILGVQANVWSSWMKTIEDMEYMVIPRIAALSEIAWLSPEKKNFSDFTLRMSNMLKLYDYLNYNYAEHLFCVEADFIPNIDSNSLEVQLNTIDVADIYYSTDGRMPTTKSNLYTTPISINKSCNFKARAHLANGLWSDIYIKNVDFNRATCRPITLNTTPDPRYSGKGLCDGVEGYTIFNIGDYWTGYKGVNLDITIDLQGVEDVTNLTLTTLSDPSSHIMDTKEISIFGSIDGKEFNRIATQAINHLQQYPMEKQIFRHNISFDNSKSRYIRVVAKPWDYVEGVSSLHPDAIPFLFISELAIN